MLPYLVSIAALVSVYALAAQGANVVVGQAGVFSVAHAALFGAGAYAFALVQLDRDATFVAAAILAALIGGALGCVLALPTWRLHGSTLVMFTFAAQEVGFNVFRHSELTGGALGVEVPGGGIVNPATTEGLPMVAATAVVATGLVALLFRTSFGRSLAAARDDRALAATLGRNTWRLRVAAFGVSGGVLGLAGALFAAVVGYVEPWSFSLMESVLILGIVLVGGAASTAGPWIGALIIVGVPEALRFVGVGAGTAANLRQVSLGLLLLVIAVYRPWGILGALRHGWRE